MPQFSLKMVQYRSRASFFRLRSTERGKLYHEAVMGRLVLWFKQGNNISVLLDDEPSQKANSFGLLSARANLVTKVH